MPNYGFSPDEFELQQRLGQRPWAQMMQPNAPVLPPLIYQISKWMGRGPGAENEQRIGALQQQVDTTRGLQREVSGEELKQLIAQGGVNRQKLSLESEALKQPGALISFIDQMTMPSREASKMEADTAATKESTRLAGPQLDLQRDQLGAQKQIANNQLLGQLVGPLTPFNVVQGPKGKPQQAPNPQMESAKQELFGQLGVPMQVDQGGGGADPALQAQFMEFLKQRNAGAANPAPAQPFQMPTLDLNVAPPGGFDWTRAMQTPKVDVGVAEYIMQLLRDYLAPRR